MGAWSMAVSVVPVVAAMPSQAPRSPKQSENDAWTGPPGALPAVTMSMSMSRAAMASQASKSRSGRPAKACCGCSTCIIFGVGGVGGERWR